MTTIDDLISKCKGGVYLTVNDHKNSYQNVEEYFDDISGHREIEIYEKEYELMKENDIVYELQFYPNTPVGFYHVYGSSLEYVLGKAEECLRQDGLL